ncbi:MAG: dTMP kinase, partial [Pseudomonadales bacterium]
LLDAPVEVGLARALARSEPDRIEQEKLAFFQRVRQGYLERAAQLPSQFCLIDAAQDLLAVQCQIDTVLRQRLEV